MRMTNSCFSAHQSLAALGLGVPAQFVYVMPTKSAPGVAYTFAEFEAARRAVRRAFEERNWDGYGALPIREETKENALAMLNHLEVSTFAPEITPNPNGTLSFEWETNQGFGRLEVGRTRYSFCVKLHNGSPFLDGGDVSEMNPALGVLVGALLFPKPPQPVSAASI